MTGRLLLAGTFAVALFACSPAPAPSPSAGVTFPASPPTSGSPGPLPSSLAAPPCRADELVLDLAGWEGAAGSRFAVVTAQAEQDRACSLSGRPGVAIVDGDNEIIIDWIGDPEGAPRVDPGDPIVVVGRDTSAALTIGIANWCGAPPPPPLGVLLTFIDESTQGFTPAVGTIGDLPPCLEPTAPARVFVQAPWQPLN